MMRRSCLGSDGIWKAVHGMKAGLIMVVVQAASAGINVFFKLAANDGMNLSILIAYRFLFASAFMVPLALFVERKKRPKLSWKVLMQAFFCGLFGGTMGQNLYLESLALTSATYASAMSNLVPGITFILAVSLGMEKLRLGTMDGKAKVLGTVMGMGGAMLLTLYKGMEINPWPTHINLLHHQYHGSGMSNTHGPADHRALGSLVAVCSCFCYAIWLIIQSKMIDSYPYYYTTTALMTVMGSIQSVAYALLRERDWVQWKLGWNIRLLTVSYAGIIGSGLMITLITWCVRMRGPVFVSVFSPLLLVIVAFVGSMILDEKLHLGSILGAGLIVCGLYVVLWGKGKEMKRLNQLVPSLHSGPSVVELVIHDALQDNIDHLDSNSVLSNLKVVESSQDDVGTEEGSDIRSVVAAALNLHTLPIV